MSINLVQFNSGDHVLGNKNIVESVVTNDDIVFNESYIVVGELLGGRRIHATYDLDVIADIRAESISVNGDLYVKGNVEADELICHGIFVCTGEVRVKKLDLDSYVAADSIVGEEVYSGGDMFVRTTIDTDIAFEAAGLAVAGEGIMGDGTFKAKAVIANEYFEFTGDSEGKIFEISGLKFPTSVAEKKTVLDFEDIDISKVPDIFTKSLSDWSELEEDELISKIHEVTEAIGDLYFVERVVDSVVELSYEREISNFRDYLYVLCARNVFPKELAEYETLNPVLEDMFNEAVGKVDTMEYKASNIEEFACSLYILNAYSGQLPISIEDGADKIFSSIGLRYSTVERVWRAYNG